MTFAQDIMGAHGSLIERVSAAINTYRANRADRLAKQRVYNETLRELRSLSARDMADIGIDPSNIESMAYEAAYGK